MTAERLGYLLEGHARVLSETGAETPVRGVTSDSRKVEPGFLFVAIPGTRDDGARYMADAARRGAAAILTEPMGDTSAVSPDVALAFSLDVRRSLALAAARFYPGQPDFLCAVTGTAGKTSVAFFLRRIFEHLGCKAAYLGTIGLIEPGKAVCGSLTTPDPVDLHQTLDRLAREGVTHMALEASSHGLDQRRLDGVRMKAGGFTNLGRDHLDYHPTVEAYFKAKMRLFTEVMPPDAIAVADPAAPYAATALAYARTRGLRRLIIGAPEAGADLGVVSITARGSGQVVQFVDGSEVLLPLVGRFQADNALLAAGLAIACGAEQRAATEALALLSGVPGRMERIGSDPAKAVFVDYAHKPEALATVLSTLRPAFSGRLICVFGCGGDRDRGKRPLMGQIASVGADVVIVTDDNPRSEEPSSIRAEILAAAPGAIEIGDRAEAIETAVMMLQPGDALLVAGKGHETGQIVGDRTFAFSDAAVIRAALGEGAA